MKLVEKSIITVRNEAEDIIGHAKMCLHFADEVYYIIDPETTDETEVILRERFPQVKIEYQIRNLGENKEFDDLYSEEITELIDDSYDGNVKMGEGQFIHHYNMEFWNNKVVKPGEWFFWSAPDERFAPKDWGDVYYWVRFAQGTGRDSVYCPIHLFREEGQCYDFHDIRVISQHFIRMPMEGWKKGKGCHTGTDMRHTRLFYMPVNYYHFAYMKTTRDPFKKARDIKQFEGRPTYAYYNPMGDGWRDLPDVDDQGNIITREYPPYEQTPVVNLETALQAHNRRHEAEMRYEMDKAKWEARYEKNRELWLKEREEKMKEWKARYEKSREHWLEERAEKEKEWEK